MLGPICMSLLCSLESQRRLFPRGNFILIFHQRPQHYTTSVRTALQISVHFLVVLLLVVFLGVAATLNVRELNYIIFFCKCLYRQIDLNVHDFVSFVTHGRTRLSNSLNLVKNPYLQNLCILSFIF